MNDKLAECRRILREDDRDDVEGIDHRMLRQAASKMGEALRAVASGPDAVASLAAAAAMYVGRGLLGVEAAEDDAASMSHWARTLVKQGEPAEEADVGPQAVRALKHLHELLTTLARRDSISLIGLADNVQAFLQGLGTLFRHLGMPETARNASRWGLRFLGDYGTE